MVVLAIGKNVIIINFKTGKPDILKVVFPIVHGGSDLARKKKHASLSNCMEEINFWVKQILNCVRPAAMTFPKIWSSWILC